MDEAIDKTIRIKGLATQDHELEMLRNTWERTPMDVRADFLDWLACEDSEESKQQVQDFPLQWFPFIQQAACCGIREAVLRHAALDDLPALDDEGE